VGEEEEDPAEGEERDRDAGEEDWETDHDRETDDETEDEREEEDQAGDSDKRGLKDRTIKPENSALAISDHPPCSITAVTCANPIKKPYHGYSCCFCRCEFDVCMKCAKALTAVRSNNTVMTPLSGGTCGVERVMLVQCICACDSQ
jgi:hypothetical protein